MWSKKWPRFLYAAVSTSMLALAMNIAPQSVSQGIVFGWPFEVFTSLKADSVRGIVIVSSWKFSALHLVLNILIFSVASVFLYHCVNDFILKKCKLFLWEFLVLILVLSILLGMNFIEHVSVFEGSSRNRSEYQTFESKTTLGFPLGWEWDEVQNDGKLETERNLITLIINFVGCAIIALGLLLMIIFIARKFQDRYRIDHQTRDF